MFNMQKQNMPDDWDIIELGSIASLVNGFAFKSQDYVAKGILNFRVTNIRENGRIDVTENIEFLPSSFTVDYKNYLLAADDILVVMVGATRGKLAIIPAEILPALMNQNMWRINAQDTLKVNQRFLFNFLSFVVPDFVNRFSESTRGFFKKEDFRAIEINLPPLPEQRRIAHVLAIVQTAIEQQAQLIALTRELKSALMHKLFTKGLRGEKQKETEMGLVPESWDILPLDAYAIVQTGTAKGRSIKDDESLELPYLRVANVQDGYLDLAEIKTIRIRATERERYLLKKGDVILTEGGDFDKLGRGFIWQGQIENCVHQNHIFAVRVNPDRLLSQFFAYQSQSPYGKRYFLSVAHKTSNLACINTAKLKRFPVLIPKLNEQEQIAHVLQTIDGKLSSHSRKRDLLEELFRTLLYQLMTGQMRVNDIDLPGLS